jgi:hypothetical protein
MRVVADISDVLSELVPDVRTERPKILDVVGYPISLSSFFRVSFQILIYETLNVVLVLRLQATFFIPNRVETSTPNHEITGATDCEVRI